MEYLGGTYISQIQAASLSQAIEKFPEELNVEAVLGFEESDLVAFSAALAGDEPVLLDGLVGVWCLSALVRDHLALVHIIDVGGG